MLSGKILRDAIISGANNIINNKESVDELNVFPVPDGDTGTNMSMTIRNAVAELNMLSDSVTVETVAQTAASAMLRGARGNSRSYPFPVIQRPFKRSCRKARGYC